MIQAQPLTVLVDGFVARNVTGFAELRAKLSPTSDPSTAIFREWLAKVSSYVAERLPCASGTAIHLARTVRGLPLGTQHYHDTAVANYRTFCSELRQLVTGNERRHLETLMSVALAYRAEAYEDILDTIDVVSGSHDEVNALYESFREFVERTCGGFNGV